MKHSIIIYLFLGQVTWAQNFSGRPTIIDDNKTGELEILSSGGPVNLIKPSDKYLRLSLGNPYHIRGLYHQELSYVQGFKKFSYSIQAHRFGTDFYAVQGLLAGLSNNFDWGTLGVGINYNWLSVEEYGTGDYFTFQIGGLFQFSDRVYYESSVTNISLANNDVPGHLTIRGGIITKVNDQFHLSGTFIRVIDSGSSFLFNLDFAPHDKLRFYMTMDPINATVSGGIKIIPGKWSIGYFHLNRQNLKNSGRWETELWF